MDVLIVSPYHGGSHHAWAMGYQKYSAFNVGVLSLPARFWKWRMHGGAVTLADTYQKRKLEPDLVVATDMLDLGTFQALSQTSGKRTPCALYMHENQLTYPLPDDPETGPMRRQLGERDLHYAFINYSSMLCADHIFFNSTYHKASFFEELPRFLRHFPDSSLEWTQARLRDKSEVLPVGVDLAQLQPSQASPVDQVPPLILWNHRWEYDKNPSGFFRAVVKLADQGIPFRLAVCGMNFRNQPSEFEAARQELADRIVHWGFAPPDLYRQLLWRSTVVVSTALHEFFGISVVEAIACRTHPLLPHRLSYPQLIPDSFHADCLYQRDSELAAELEKAILDPSRSVRLGEALATEMERFDWRRLAPEYDDRLAKVALG